MTDCRDWLEETRDIKKSIAKRYADVPMSQQLREMHSNVVEEFRKRGWTYPEHLIAMRTKNVDSSNL